MLTLCRYSLALEVIFRVVANVFSRYSVQLSGLDEELCKKDGMLKPFPPSTSRGLTVSVRAQ